MLECRLKNKKKERLGKFIPPLVILCIIAFTMTGCQKENEESPNTPIFPEETETMEMPYSSPFKAVTTPVHFVAMTENPLEIVTIDESNGGIAGDSYVQVRGMKDQNLQEEINKRILAFHEQVKQVMEPPYRGIKRALGEDMKLKDQSVYTYVSYSFDNLLSVISTSNLMYSNGTPSEDLYMDFSDAFTIDLATGEEVYFEDLFSNGSDYETLINNYVKTYLDKEFASDEEKEWFGASELISPFLGIRKNPKFFLSYNTITLILDAATPEFNTRYNTAYLQIPYLTLKDVIAIKERFVDGQPGLYLDESPQNIVMISSYDKYVTGSSIQEEKDGVTYYVNYRYPPEVPQSAVEDFVASLNLDEPAKEGVTSVYKEGSMFYTGDFISASVQKNYTYNYEKFEFENEFRLYDLDGRALELQDLFNPGYDYKSRIMSELQKMLTSINNIEGITLEELYEGLTFHISTGGLYFATESIQQSETEVLPLNFVLLFSEIGIENLTVFDW